MDKIEKVSVIVFVLAIMIIFTSFVFASSDKFSIGSIDNFTITWNLVQDKTNNIIYDVSIKNELNFNRDFDLNFLLRNINVNIDDIVIYEKKIQEVETNFLNNTLECFDMLDENNTVYENCYEVSYPYTIKNNVAIWKETKSNVNKLFSGIDYGLINIPKATSKPKYDDFGNIETIDGTKFFKVRLTNFDTIIYDGELGIMNGLTNSYIHPLINSTGYFADFNADNHSVNSLTVTSNKITGVPLDNSIQDGLIAVYTFDNGDVTDDYSNKDGENHGADLSYNCKKGQCYHLTASESDYINISPASPTDQSSTITYWYHSDSNCGAGGDEIIVSGYKDATNRYHFALWQTGGTSFTFYVTDTGTTNSDYVSNCNNQNNGAWNFISVSSTGNGNFEARANLNNLTDITPNTDLVSPKRLYLGAYADKTIADSYFYDGYIDEVTVYDRVLTYNEISELYNNFKSLTYPFIDANKYFSDTFSVNQTSDTVVINYNCVGTCEVNLTIDGINYNVSNGYVLIIPETIDFDFNYSIILLNTSSLANLSIIFSEFVEPDPPSQFDLFSPLNNSEYNTEQNIIFTWNNSYDNDSSLLNYTLNIFNDSLYFSIELENITTYNLTIHNIYLYYWNVTVRDEGRINYSIQTFILNITPIYSTCNIYNACIDGVKNCTSGTGNYTSLYQNCNSLAYTNFWLYIALIGIALVLMFFALISKANVLGVVGGFIALLVSAGMMVTYFYFGMILLLFFLGITFVFIARGLSVY